MSARRKGKRAQSGVRPDWWRWPTFWIYNTDRWINGMKVVRVDLILPDATKVDLEYFPAAATPDELRRDVGERFKEIWDPVKRCRRPPAT